MRICRDKNQMEKKIYGKSSNQKRAIEQKLIPKMVSISPHIKYLRSRNWETKKRDRCRTRAGKQLASRNRRFFSENVLCRKLLHHCVFLLHIAIAAIHWSASTRLERNLGLFPAFATGGIEHLTRTLWKALASLKRHCFFLLLHLYWPAFANH